MAVIAQCGRKDYVWLWAFHVLLPPANWGVHSLSQNIGRGYLSSSTGGYLGVGLMNGSLGAASWHEHVDLRWTLLCCSRLFLLSVIVHLVCRYTELDRHLQPRQARLFIRPEWFAAKQEGGTEIWYFLLSILTWRCTDFCSDTEFLIDEETNGGPERWPEFPKSVGKLNKTYRFGLLLFWKVFSQQAATIRPN